MTVPVTIFEDNGKAAHAVLKYFRELRPSIASTFSLRPYNRFSPAFTEWWLIPRKEEWPAYRCSKFFVSNFQSPSESFFRLYAGYYVEQGLGAELTGLPEVKRNHIMHADWYWHSFLQHAQGGRLDDALKQVLESSNCPICILVDAYEFNKVPEPDTEDRFSHDSVQFTIPSLELEFQLSKPGKEILSQFNTSPHIRSLARQLGSTKDLHFFWLDLHIGILLEYGNQERGSWDAAEIWHNALDPWNAWVE